MEVRLHYPKEFLHSLHILLGGVFKGLPERRRSYRYTLYVAAAVLALLAGTALLARYAHVSKSVVAGQSSLSRMEALKAEYAGKKAALDALAARAAQPGESAVAAVEELARRTGMKERITSIKPLEEKEFAGYSEKAVEVRLEGVDLGRLVNLLYLAEHGERLVLVRDITIKQRFEDQELVDATLRASVVTRR